MQSQSSPVPKQCCFFSLRTYEAVLSEDVPWRQWEAWIKDRVKSKMEELGLLQATKKEPQQGGEKQRVQHNPTKNELPPGIIFYSPLFLFF